jgi:hypothetical protein
MKSIVSPEVFAMFPDHIRGVIIAGNIDNQGEKAELVDLLRKPQ